MLKTCDIIKIFLVGKGWCDCPLKDNKLLEDKLFDVKVSDLLEILKFSNKIKIRLGKITFNKLEFQKLVSLSRLA